MTKIFLAGIFALSASTSLAQTTPPQPAAPAVEAQGGQTVASQQGGPANLCQELLAFMKAPPEEAAPAGAAKPAAAPAQQGASAQQTGSAQQPAHAQQSGSNQQGSSALAGTTAADASAKTEGASGSAQAVTGQKGVATDSPEPGKDKAASGSVANAPQKDTRAAPTPPADVTSTPKESVLTVEAAEQLASANDLAQCQKTARQMRVAGVAMPPPLIALAALDLRYQQQSTPEQPSDGAGGGAAPQPPAPQ